MVEAAGAVLVLPDGRWVMQRRTDDAPTDPGKLSFFGGWLERGETPQQALWRELAEETSLNLPKRRFPLVCQPAVVTRGGKDCRLHVHRVEIPSMNFEVFEGKGAEAFSLGALRRRDDLSDVAQAVLKSIGEK